jgi:hypothetical protein
MTPEFMHALLLLGIAAFNAFTAFMAWRTLGVTKRTEANVAIVEKATNSMKDALVLAAGKAGFQQGVDSTRQL